MKRNLLNVALITVFCLVFTFGFTACGDKNGKVSTKTLGDGENNFFVEIEKENGDTVKYEIKTDDVIVGRALEDNKLIKYAKTKEGGEYVCSVDGNKVDFDKDKKFWALYTNDQYLTSSPNDIGITCGAIYTFKIDSLDGKGIEITK